jgi:Glycosyl hydrolase family 79 C-terminal beta domain
MTQIIGKGCATQVAPLLVTGQPPAYINRIVGYTAYHQGQLATIVLINTAIANVSETSKNSLTIDLFLPNFAGKTLYLSYLTAAGADAKHGTMWNGTSYEQSGDGTPTKVNNTIHTVVVASNGTARLTLRDSQAVVANIGSYVGSHPANRTACSALARTVPDAASEVSTGMGSASSSTQSSTASSSSMRLSASSSTSILTASTSMMTAIMGSSSPTAAATSVTGAFAKQFLKFTLTTMIGLVITLFL